MGTPSSLHPPQQTEDVTQQPNDHHPRVGSRCSVIIQEDLKRHKDSALLLGLTDVHNHPSRQPRQALLASTPPSTVRLGPILPGTGAKGRPSRVPCKGQCHSVKGRHAQRPPPLSKTPHHFNSNRKNVWKTERESPRRCGPSENHMSLSPTMPSLAFSRQESSRPPAPCWRNVTPATGAGVP